MSVFRDLQIKFQTATIVNQLIYINVAVFLLTFLLNTLGFLMQSNGNIITQWFAMPAFLDDFIYKPWTIITYGFLHGGFLHILFNMLLLNFFGRLFLDYFTPKQLLNFYLLGTFFGGLVYLLSYNFFPIFSENRSILVGASAAVSAIVVGLATYAPNYQLNFRFIGFVKLWHLAAILVVLDVIQIPLGNAGGHLAHIGGALFGFLYVSKASNKELDLFSAFNGIFTKKRSPLKTVYKSKNATKTSRAQKDNNQQKIDEILDKISKSGYDTLSKEEKEFLFKQGK